MLLTARAEHVDLLQVLAATRRQIEVRLDTPEPPRKPQSGFWCAGSAAAIPGAFSGAYGG